MDSKITVGTSPDINELVKGNLFGTAADTVHDSGPGQGRSTGAPGSRFSICVWKYGHISKSSSCILTYRFSSLKNKVDEGEEQEYLF